MEGLSPAAKVIIESFSSLEILIQYYLIGGTSLALQINHRLSEDLDFCQWIPRYHVSHAIPAEQILEELKNRFSRVEENRPVKITFYQTFQVRLRRDHCLNFLVVSRLIGIALSFQILTN